MWNKERVRAYTFAPWTVLYQVTLGYIDPIDPSGAGDYWLYFSHFLVRITQHHLVTVNSRDCLFLSFNVLHLFFLKSKTMNVHRVNTF